MNFCLGQSVLPQDSNNGEEGGDYLLRLRVGEGAPDQPTHNSKSSAESAGTATAIDWESQRQSPRHRCSGSVEFRAQGCDAKVWGTLTDVSLHGCYVEMNSTFPVGTQVHLVLKSFGIRVEVGGKVRTTYPFMGMGIGFDEIALEPRLRLQELLEVLAGQRAVSGWKSALEKSVADRGDPADLKALVDEITEFFRDNQALSREDFHKMAKQLRRP
jgi:hypothetical protein